MQYPSSLMFLEKDLSEAPATSVTALAHRMIEGAKRLDLEKAQHLGVNHRLKHLTRNADTPPNYTDTDILGASWADDIHAPLQPGERWNVGRRATNTGVEYELDNYGNPINPYMNTGLTGRGVLGQFGPNHAVDNGMLVIKFDASGRSTLYALGILRKHDNNAPAFSGGFAKYKKDTIGTYIFDQNSVIDSQTEELFEEMISGSIPIFAEYAAQIEGLFIAEIEKCMKKNGGKTVTSAKQQEIREQIETALKLQQVQDKDPGFLERLRETVANGRECFAGPVLNDNRSTNKAWIETRLSWFMMDKEKWDYIKGDKPVFDYQFSTGDDASGVVYHRLDKNLIQNAFASHGPMFIFMAASFLLDAQRRGLHLDPHVIKQMEEIDEFLNRAAPIIPSHERFRQHLEP